MKKNLLKRYLQKKNTYVIIMRSQLTLKKYGIKQKLLLMMYFYLTLPFKLPKVMMETLPEAMKKLNHNPSKNVDVERIGRNGKKQFKHN